jgi:hypothetical protein
MRLPEEDFRWIADTVGLWGKERDALRMRVVAGLDARAIAKELGVKVMSARDLLASSEAQIRAHPWPKGELAWLRMLLNAMRGPRNHAPKSSLIGQNAYTGRIEEAVLRTRYPNEWDFMPEPPNHMES